MPSVMYSPLIKTAKQTVIIMQSLILSLTRGALCAPKFCPTKVMTAMPIALSISHVKASTLPIATQAAAVSVPKPLIAVRIIMFDTE